MKYGDMKGLWIGLYKLIFFIVRLKLQIFCKEIRSEMRLRYFKDDCAFFTILGIDSLEGLLSLQTIIDTKSFESLDDVIQYIYTNREVFKEIYKLTKDYGNRYLLISMNQISACRTSKANNLLYFSSSALFYYEMKYKKIKFNKAVFNIRKTIDEDAPTIIVYNDLSAMYIDDNWFKYICTKYPIKNIKEYFKDKCKDHELSQYLLNIKYHIDY